MTHTAQTPAERIVALLHELNGGVHTEETVLRYRTVRRGRRDVAIPDFVIHRTNRPGLRDQLGTVQADTATAPVQVRRWQRDSTCPHDEDTLCSHGRWVHVRTEQRPIAGLIAVGAAVPGGSPGWDADGALSPQPSGGSFESAEPIADAWHVADEIREGLLDIGRDLHAAGWRPPDTLVTVALADEEAGREIVGRLRSLVSRARIAAGYDAPIVPLRDVYCPLCGGEMRVRKDASSPVWCAGMVPLHGPAVEDGPWPIGFARCGAKWPRGSWVKLLKEATNSERMAG